VLTGLTLLAGCANGDFGEIKPWLVRDDIHDWVAADATGAIPSSRFELTDDERQLRDLAYPLVEPPWLRHTATSIAREYGAFPGQYHSGIDTTAYAANLIAPPRVSASSRYARLTDDIRNDSTRLPQFFETAARVVDMDSKRRKSFVYISVSSEPERTNAARRMNENAAIIAQVRRSLVQRIVSYKFALERLVITTPSSQAIESEQMLNQLSAVTARYRNGAPLGRAIESSLGRISY